MTDGLIGLSIVGIAVAVLIIGIVAVVLTVVIIRLTPDRHVSHLRIFFAVILIASLFVGAAVLLSSVPSFVPYNQSPAASGHLGYDEVKEFIETVQPKLVVPVHTQNPEVFKNLPNNVIIPEKGVEYTVG